jgi:hypothetical protein
MVHYRLIVYRLLLTFLLVGLAAGLSLTVLNDSALAYTVAAATAAPGLKIIQSNASTLVLELDVPAYELQTIATTRDHFVRIAVDGATDLAAQGRPELPKFSALVGVPAQGPVSVRVVEDSVEALPGRYQLAPAAAPAPIAGDLRPGAMQRVPDLAAYASTELYPTETARVVETAWLRDQRVARIEVYPFQYRAATGALRWHRPRVGQVRRRCRADRLAAAPAADGPFDKPCAAPS